MIDRHGGISGTTNEARFVAASRIETARLVLRGPTEDDLDDVVGEINNFAVVRMLARVPFPYTRRDAENYLAWSRTSRNDVNLVITRAGRAIGCVGLTDLQATCEFGYWLGQSHWGQGLASEAGRAFLGYCFAEFGVDAIWAGAFTDNPASLRVQAKLGFETTGITSRLSLARHAKVEHIDTVLTRVRFAKAGQ